MSARDNPTVLIDPYRSGALGGRISHGPIDRLADVVAVTHYHEDHGWIGALPGSPEVVDCSTTVQGLQFDCVTLPHDCVSGSHMGLSRMIAFDYDGIRILHTGDIGRLPTEQELTALGAVDLLLLPIGGTYTIGPKVALELREQLAPRWTVPMHYRSSKVDLDMVSRQEFLDVLSDGCRVEHTNGATLDCHQDGVSGTETVVLLEPSL